MVDEATILQQYVALFVTIFVDEDENVPNFLNSERLSIMSQLNHINALAPNIFEDDRYWRYIRKGIYDYDAYCRKLAKNILQQSIGMFQTQPKLKS